MKLSLHTYPRYARLFIETAGATYTCTWNADADVLALLNQDPTVRAYRWDGLEETGRARYITVTRNSVRNIVTH